MADDTRGQNESSPPAVTTAPVVDKLSQPPKKFPTGVVLGKDGKPYVAYFSLSVLYILCLLGVPNESNAEVRESAHPRPTAPDVEVLGRSSWTLLHSIAATYPETPSTSQQSDLLGFVHLFAKLYPCWTCAEDFQSYLARTKPRVNSRSEFGLWLCDAHNDVNKKLGKPMFDCSLWEQRWRTGWKDGRCD
ncbi:hypothetical protein jhhlp_005679 [Lomentospora prolificans]|uniref:Sulfhydryl oxidase n=1 Tax=Lomentospora prolificans TaxID=41688 RepID=A0A2N3N3U9_9PEZI|nr:hypothetical protein jhhlp_005679 [Lomentospora prolificans]